MSDAKIQKILEEQTKKAKENWIPGIDPRLEVMNAVPLVLSTPVEFTQPKSDHGQERPVHPQYPGFG